MKDKTTTTHTPGPWTAHGMAIYAQPVRRSFGGPSREYLCPVASSEGNGYMAGSELAEDEAFFDRLTSGQGCNVRLPGEAEALANARLIAAAPELLGALKAMMHADECISENRGHKSDQAMQRIAALDLATAAIARAEGGGK